MSQAVDWTLTQTRFQLKDVKLHGYDALLPVLSQLARHGVIECKK